MTGCPAYLRRAGTPAPLLGTLFDKVGRASLPVAFDRPFPRDKRIIWIASQSCSSDAAAAGKSSRNDLGKGKWTFSSRTHSSSIVAP